MAVLAGMNIEQVRIIEANPQNFSTRSLSAAAEWIQANRTGGVGCKAFARSARLYAFAAAKSPAVVSDVKVFPRALSYEEIKGQYLVMVTNKNRIG